MTDSTEIPEDIPRLLREALEALVAPFRPLFVEAGITEQQWRVLRTLMRGPQSQVEIARACAMQPASLSGILNRMQRDGMIERSRSDADQRRQDVVISDSGRQLVRRLAPEVEAQYAAIARAVGADTLATLVNSATAVRDAAWTR